MTNNTINTLLIVVPLILIGGYCALAARLREQEHDLVNKYGVMETSPTPTGNRSRAARLWSAASVL